jgi:hypothetical protein
MSDYINSTRAPALVVPPVQYSQESGNQLNNQLRIYFNTLDVANRQTIEQVNNLNTMMWLNTGSF